MENEKSILSVRIFILMMVCGLILGLVLGTLLRMNTVDSKIDRLSHQIEQRQEKR